MSSESFNRVKQRSLEEGKRFFWIFLYLWAWLGLFSVHKSLVLNEPHLFYHQGFALINGLLLAKIMLTAEMFRAGDSLKYKPLIYPILFQISDLCNYLAIILHPRGNSTRGVAR